MRKSQKLRTVVSGRKDWCPRACLGRVRVDGTRPCGYGSEKPAEGCAPVLGRGAVVLPSPAREASSCRPRTAGAGLWG